MWMAVVSFFDPDAESIDGESTLTRRIQVIGDRAALCKLRQPSRRGKPFNWNKEKTANDAIPQREDEDVKTRKTSSPTSPVSPRPSADQCPFCFFEEGLSPEDRMWPYTRIDSLRRHVLRVHLNQASRHDYGLRGLPQPHSKTPTDDGPIICPVPTCDGCPPKPNALHESLGQGA
jgi:hypothetical protein